MRRPVFTALLVARIVASLALVQLCAAPFSISAQELTASSATQPQRNPYDVLKTAKLIFIQAKSDFMSGEKLEKELLKRQEFRNWELVITRNREEAELILEITRKVFTTRFTLSIINARDNHILAACSDTSIGGTIEPKLASGFIRELKKHRQ